MDDVENFWTAMLSGDPGEIRRAWGDLTDEEAQTVTEHLRKIIDDGSYSEDQRQAAQMALETIQSAG